MYAPRRGAAERRVLVQGPAWVADMESNVGATRDCPLPTAHCPLPTAYGPLPTAYCLLPSSHFHKILAGGFEDGEQVCQSEQFPDTRA
jgi:hypothetical protein